MVRELSRLPGIGKRSAERLTFALLKAPADEAKALADEWDDRVDTLMRGALGLTAACARCHDHKYDPISMQDYYGLAGIFAASQYQESPIVSEQVLQQKSLAEASMKEGELSVNQ